MYSSSVNRLPSRRSTANSPNIRLTVLLSFRIGSNSRVDAQFNAGWCVANAWQRGSSQLAHFDPASVADPALRPLVDRIAVVADPALDVRGHTAVDLVLTTTDGRVLRDGLDIAPGFPGAGLSDAQHRARFDDAVAYAAQVAPRTPSAAQRADFLARLDRLPALADARDLARALVA